ncbi:MAG: hypothetical protein NVSMB47_02600 [Polyangiales bacterium]
MPASTASTALSFAVVCAALCIAAPSAAQEASTGTAAPTDPAVTTSATTTTATTETTTTAIGPTPEDDDAACPYGCEQRGVFEKWKRPHFVVGLAGGVGAWSEGHPFAFDSGTGTATSLGPVWGALAGYEVFPWLAFEAHYDGLYNRGNSKINLGGTVGLLTSAASAVVRFTIPTRFVQPYAFIGVGYYSTSITGSADARAKTPFHGSKELGGPIGLGLAVPLTARLSVGAELVYHRLFGESFSDDDTIGGGDPTTGTAVLRVRL